MLRGALLMLAVLALDSTPVRLSLAHGLFPACKQYRGRWPYIVALQNMEPLETIICGESTLEISGF